MAADITNPILRVDRRAQDSRQRIIEGFSAPKEIVEVTPEFRKALVKRIGTAASKLQRNFELFPNLPSVVALRLHPDAMAKTHRPMLLLERCGMRPIGTRKFGELLLPATANSLAHLSNVAEQNEARQIRANLSTIEDIVPWGPNDVLQWDGLTQRQMHRARTYLAGWIESGKPFLVERFTSDNAQIDLSIQQAISLHIEEIGGMVGDTKPITLSRSAQFIRLESVDAALSLAALPGVRTLVPASEFLPIEIRPQMFAQVGLAPAGTLPAPTDDLPVVGVVDSGIPGNETNLGPWVIGHETFIIPPDTDHLHGTFVGGMIADARTLNGGDIKFPDTHAKILDVAALSTVGTSVDELLLHIEEAIKAHPEVKVWNCSLGSSNPGHPELFGQFAQDLDVLSDNYGVLFVVAAGNYQTPPLRPWPPVTDLLGNDRIGEPAESLRAITVGSVAHLPALVQPDDPSPFTRRGPGAAKTPKPDLTHRGGNCSEVGHFVGSGVRSLLPGGMLGESIGTSFSTPLVSSMAANIWETLRRQGQIVRPEIIKGLLIHGAALNSPTRNADERDYHGFGVPESILELLFCSPDTFTLMFEAELYDGIIWEKTPFPIPECLHVDGTHLQAEVVLTLVYSPPLDGRHGAEYVRANIDASFGSYDPDGDGKHHHHGLIPLDAPRKEDLYEKAMVDHGFKWSPVKVYHGRFPRGKAGNNFRLQLELLRRAGEAAQPDPQLATVLISFRGIKPGLPVYADGIRALHNANWTTTPIATRHQLRL